MQGIIKKILSVLSICILFTVCFSVAFNSQKLKSDLPVVIVPSESETQEAEDVQVGLDEDKDFLSGEPIESETEIETESEQVVEIESEIEISTETELKSESKTEIETESEIDTETESEIEIETEYEIYSFLQGDISWNYGRAWAGEWAIYTSSGKVFSDYGCGLCCMANIYSTLSPYVASPLDMLQFARQCTGYNVGAIPWGNVKTTLEKCGFTCSLGNKPGSYAQFQEQVKKATCSLVLISANNDNSYWTKTKGHYVTLFLYDEETDTVFLSDSGYYSNNRSRIPLYTVYKALKTGSEHQVLYVTDYTESNNVWKHNGIGQEWVKP